MTIYEITSSPGGAKDPAFYRNWSNALVMDLPSAAGDTTPPHDGGFFLSIFLPPSNFPCTKGFLV